MKAYCRPGIAAAVSVILSCLPTLAKPDSAPGLVTFTFDDATRSQYTLGLPIAQELGIPGTLFVVTEGADEATLAEAEAKAEAEACAEAEAEASAEAEAKAKACAEAHVDAVADAEGVTAFVKDRWYMSWDEIRKFRDAGWEIGSHTNTHPHLSEHEETRIAQEMDTARARIEAEVGTGSVSFAPPYGDFNARTLEMAMMRHRYHVLALGKKTGGAIRLRRSIPAVLTGLWSTFGRSPLWCVERW